MKLQRNLFSFFLLFLFCSSCDSGENEKTITPSTTISEDANQSDCRYQILYTRKINETVKDGHQASGNIEIALKANTKWLDMGEGTIETKLGGSSFFDLINRNIIEDAQYSSTFIEKHNSIIQILCDIEKDLENPKFSDKLKETLLLEKIKKRTEYFNFLLDIKKKLTIPRNEKSKKSKIKSISPSTIKIIGTVKDYVSKKTVKDAQIVLKCGGFFQTKTDDFGNFSIEVPYELKDNRCSIIATFEGKQKERIIPISDKNDIELRIR